MRCQPLFSPAGLCLVDGGQAELFSDDPHGCELGEGVLDPGNKAHREVALIDCEHARSQQIGHGNGRAEVSLLGLLTPALSKIEGQAQRVAVVLRIEFEDLTIDLGQVLVVVLFVGADPVAGRDEKADDTLLPWPGLAAHHRVAHVGTVDLNGGGFALDRDRGRAAHIARGEKHQVLDDALLLLGAVAIGVALGRPRVGHTAVLLDTLPLEDLIQQHGHTAVFRDAVVVGGYSTARAGCAR